jgi:hypothetical protein
MEQTQSRGGASLWRIHTGKDTSIIVYWDRERAFADLGLASD